MADKRLKRQDPEIDRACKRVGRNIEDLRIRQGLSQKELALKVGMLVSTLEGIEQGLKNPTVLRLCQIAKALGVLPNKLLA
jgi:transcriptional regulator with XRE-family HTH domain